MLNRQDTVERRQQIVFDEPKSLSYRRNNSSSSTFTRVNTTNSINQTYFKISHSIGLESLSDNAMADLKMDERRKKVVVLGDGGIGKTCLLAHYSTGKFPKEYVPTVFQNTHILVSLGPVLYNVALWDTAGQDDYSRLRPLSYPGTDAFLLCFAINQEDSFRNVTDKWINEIKHYTEKVPIILVGLKSDLRDDPAYKDKCVDPEAGLSLVELGIVQAYVECSSLTQFQIEKPIECALLISDKQQAEKEKERKKKSCKVM